MGSLVLFFLFAYIDEYEKLILPLFKDETKVSAVDAENSFTEEKLYGFLKDFNEQLSGAHAASNPGMAWQLPASPEVQRSIHDELVYNLTNNITVKSEVRSLVILRVEAFSPLSGKVTVLETSEGGETGRKEMAVAYIIEKGEKGLLVTDMESVARAEKEGRAAP